MKIPHGIFKDIEKNRTFEMNDKGYKTDAEGLEMVRRAIELATEEDGTINPEGVGVVMQVGLYTEKIVEMTDAEAKEYRL